MKTTAWIIALVLVAFIAGTCAHVMSGTDTLREENNSLREEATRMREQIRASQYRDSLLQVQYDSLITTNKKTIQHLNKKRDENNTIIDSAGDDELRRILAGYNF